MARVSSRKTSIFVKIVFAIVIAYLLYVLIDLQVKINAKQSNIDDLSTQISLKLDENQRLKDDRDAEIDKEYAEKIAREHGYVNSDEKVYEIVS